ncbi:pyridoxamine 5'-phosphate oxidase family protein [Candidatus Nitrosocosmicus arcticus]|uniref:Putative pyridoxamine 5'-phosphate oxidase n=1 Tax=Candidatus Nitrosocosmicus arcticus TaxID=2035267 RepID=A0A557SRH5_9ARCH|nr:pyridoxamine 5'-phosphate oxidase family protein [Candidatus Nitrosocosmicus arcticus]TVP39203.1 putative pyridoxamine 5'-phosphate oxidase [Candidatus Nitrosocosmicus arcticus]
MQLTSRFRIKNIKNIIEFLNDIHVGRLATIDVNGYPQIIPMNFVHTVTNLTSKNLSLDYEKPTYQDDESENTNNNFKIANNVSTKNPSHYKHVIYMHSHHRGEKIENLVRNQKVGFEVDKEICFLPSYYFHPTDASFADTLYTSIVIKGKASIVSDNQEKAFAMNKMMQKYQSEGKYIELTQNAKSIIYLTVIKINVDTIDGKYKIGQEWSGSFRKDIANKIIQREGITTAREVLKDMNINILKNGELELPISVSMDL